jgi:tripartite-type tricarboxylate transporter receptor subunit TctC
MTRRELLVLLSSLGIPSFLLPPDESPQSGCMRGRGIRWLVGWSPGGGYDAYVRLAEPLLERAWDAEIVIDNQPGAGGRSAAVVLSRARPDGRTLGIVDAPGLLWWAGTGDRTAPSLARDFTLLARIARPQQLIAAGARSGIRSLEDVVALARRRPVIFGVTAPGSQNFVTSAVTMAILGIDARFVAGYAGSREVLLGAIRGDFDLLSLSAETAIDQIGSGDVIPLAMVIPDGGATPGLPDIPALSGPGGIVQQRPDLTPNRERALALAETINQYLSAGRLIAAPAGLPDEMRRCLESGLQRVLPGRELLAAATRAGRTLSIAFGDELRRDVDSARAAVTLLQPVSADAQRRVR